MLQRNSSAACGKGSLTRVQAVDNVVDRMEVEVPMPPSTSLKGKETESGIGESRACSCYDVMEPCVCVTLELRGSQSGICCNWMLFPGSLLRLSCSVRGMGERGHPL